MHEQSRSSLYNFQFCIVTVITNCQTLCTYNNTVLWNIWCSQDDEQSYGGRFGPKQSQLTTSAGVSVLPRCRWWVLTFLHRITTAVTRSVTVTWRRTVVAARHWTRRWGAWKRLASGGGICILLLATFKNLHIVVETYLRQQLRTEEHYQLKVSIIRTGNNDKWSI